MARCPHCGEVATKDQEFCFACGQRIRVRARRGGQPVNALIFVLAGVLVLGGVTGIIIVNSGQARRARREAALREQERVRDSARAATWARRDSAKTVAQINVAGILADEVNRLEERFNVVRQQVVKDQPSPAQAKLISDIRSEMVRLRQLTVTIAGQTGPRGDSLKAQLRDGERVVRTLISSLSRAPKK
jgi:hypothetical protein